MDRSEIKAAVCPLCGGPNGCAIAEGRAATSCWCMSVVICADVLARVPDALQGRVCICAACAGAQRGRSEV
ncbi:cysteine-rich CWC family protein [Cohnella sp. 56]|uniref:cysteine-rich CWC family protein n=1 Tax=Cohnella sp. 56 TaxID=3113722 RepID=UPI0030EA89DF